ncbi:MAG: 1-acyl-sn-glycerol-3-phosphate acyltransferase [Saprospiraceae bacterium]|nr:1-acyl-sn-glycerol-3-phosphate acyltransferase [Saprospiraceae bacterium]
MTATRKLLGKIWAVYGMLVFFVMLLILFPFYLIILGLFPTSWFKPVIWFNHHVYPRIFFALVGIRIKVHNRKVLDTGRQYILVSNHRSAIDFMANTVAFPNVYKYLAKKELTKVPFLGFVIKKLCVLVDRSSTASRMKSLEWMKKSFDEGYSLFFYPEGTRNKSGEGLGVFFSGAFRLAQELRVPIAVMTLQNVHKRSGSARSMDLFPGTLHIRWSGVVTPSDNTTHESLMQETRAMMARDLMD